MVLLIRAYLCNYVVILDDSNVTITPVKRGVFVSSRGRGAGISAIREGADFNGTINVPTCI